MEKLSTLDDVPTDILLEIAGRLLSLRDVLVFSRICKELSALRETRAFWTTVLENHRFSTALPCPSSTDFSKLNLKALHDLVRRGAKIEGQWNETPIKSKSFEASIGLMTGADSSSFLAIVPGTPLALILYNNSELMMDPAIYLQCWNMSTGQCLSELNFPSGTQILSWASPFVEQKNNRLVFAWAMVKSRKESRDSDRRVVVQVLELSYTQKYRTAVLRQLHELPSSLRAFSGGSLALNDDIVVHVSEVTRVQKVVIVKAWNLKTKRCMTLSTDAFAGKTVLHTDDISCWIYDKDLYAAHRSSKLPRLDFHRSPKENLPHDQHLPVGMSRSIDDAFSLIHSHLYDDKLADYKLDQIYPPDNAAQNDAIFVVHSVADKYHRVMVEVWRARDIASSSSSYPATRVQTFKFEGRLFFSASDNRGSLLVLLEDDEDLHLLRYHDDGSVTLNTLKLPGTIYWAFNDPDEPSSEPSFSFTVDHRRGVVLFMAQVECREMYYQFKLFEVSYV